MESRGGDRPRENHTAYVCVCDEKEERKKERKNERRRERGFCCTLL
jgi:hypothetical protein